MHATDNNNMITDEYFVYNPDSTVSERIDSVSELQGTTLVNYEIWHSYFSYNSGDIKPVKDSTTHIQYNYVNGFHAG